MSDFFFILYLSWSENIVLFFNFENIKKNRKKLMFSHTANLLIFFFSKIEKNEVFAHRGPVDIFGSIQTCAHLSSKWVNFYILHDLKWKYGSFLHFRKLFKKSKNLSPFLAEFRRVHIFQANEWIFIFYLSLSENIVLFFKFSLQLTSRYFWLNSHMCTFVIQMSEFLYFSCH